MFSGLSLQYRVKEYRVFVKSKWRLALSYLINKIEVLQKKLMTTDKVLHKGGCHCKRVRWQVKALSEVVCWDCNCSNCTMRQNLHFIVPAIDFEVEGASRQWLTEYTFGTHLAKHLFCKVCGICSFYIPRSNPDGVAVTIHCVDPGTVKGTEVRKFDGQNWDAAFTSSSISACSEN